MCSILEGLHLLTLELVKKIAIRTFSSTAFDLSSDLPEKLESTAIDPTAGGPEDIEIFYLHTRTRMVAKRIQNSLTLTSWTTLLLKRKCYTQWGADGTVSYDGSTMLFIIVLGINTSTRVGVSDLKSNLRLVRLTIFQNNVTDLTDKMMTDYKLILGKKISHEDMVLDLITALLLGKNNIFLGSFKEGKTTGRPGRMRLTRVQLKLRGLNTTSW